MKYFKVFNNTAELLLYKNSSIYVTPNLLLDRSNKTVDYNSKMLYDHKIEYLSTGTTKHKYTQYIDTGILNSANTSITLKVAIDGNDCLSGAEYTIKDRFKFGTGGGGTIYYGYKNNYNTEITASLNDIYTFYLSYGNQYVKNSNDEIILQSTDTLYYYSQYNITLFRCISGDDFVKTNNGIVRIYECTIENENTKIHLIPVRIGEIGYMYDTIHNKLYENKSNELFTLGPDI